MKKRDLFSHQETNRLADFNYLKTLLNELECHEARIETPVMLCICICEPALNTLQSSPWLQFYNDIHDRCLMHRILYSNFT